VSVMAEIASEGARVIKAVYPIVLGLPLPFQLSALGDLPDFQGLGGHRNMHRCKCSYREMEVCVSVIISETLRMLYTDRLLAAFQPVATPPSGRGALYGGSI
jgi:hypothetical protein